MKHVGKENPQSCVSSRWDQGLLSNWWHLIDIQTSLSLGPAQPHRCGRARERVPLRWQSAALHPRNSRCGAREGRQRPCGRAGCGTAVLWSTQGIPVPRFPPREHSLAVSRSLPAAAERGSLICGSVSSASPGESKIKSGVSELLRPRGGCESSPEQHEEEWAAGSGS